MGVRNRLTSWAGSQCQNDRCSGREAGVSEGRRGGRVCCRGVGELASDGEASVAPVTTWSEPLRRKEEARTLE